MKIRVGFVTNSSSTAYYIKNISKEVKTIVDFVKENMHILHEFNDEYVEKQYSEAEMSESAQALIRNEHSRKYHIWKPGERHVVAFGDEDGTAIGRVFGYGLRDGGKSESFEYEFYEYWR